MGRLIDRVTAISGAMTVDAEQALKFSQTYIPSCDTILVQLNWGGLGGIFYFPCQIQIETLKGVGRERYIKLPEAGTNPRGVEITGEAINILANHPQVLKIPVEWNTEAMEYNPYGRWLELWERDQMYEKRFQNQQIWYQLPNQP